ncbi:putative O-acyltransferase [Zalerion maritima]|uniref:O-acyltransferase n=1 Tax=Zalerion maritima TaxID=339359 RepID=A0AAD5WPD3_9PEZI|nr:putative O-acyltransferase [Zalerion maritima]
MLPYINLPFEWLSRLIGASTDELKLIFSILVSYPLAGALKRIPDSKPEQKNIFSISVSLFFLVGLFDLWVGLRTISISAAGAYAIAKYLRTSPYMPWLGFVFTMGHLSVNQLARQFHNEPASVDITGAQMVLVMKLSAFCWNVADGTLSEEHLSDFQKDHRLVELPSLLDYAGYVLFFPSLLVGPAFDFVEYRRYIDCTMFDVPVTIDPTRRPPTRKKRKIPRSATPALVKGASGLLWIFAFLQLSNYYWPGSLLTEEYSKRSFFYRVFSLYMVGVTARTKYYGVWSMTEGACILAGLGFNGVDPKTGRISWDRVKNINPWGVEMAQNTRAYLANWNMNTNSWLRNYIYLRVTPRGRKPGFRASFATFSTSAFWHGFYPGYYLSFMLASFIQTSAKNFRRFVRPFVMDPLNDKEKQKPTKNKIYYDILSWFTTQVTFAFVAQPFLILGLSESLQIWRSVYFYAVIGTAVSMAFFASPAKAILKKKAEERAAKAAGKGRPSHRLVRTSSTDSITNDRLPVLGVMDDPQQELDDAVKEIRSDLEYLRQSGMITQKEVADRLNTIMGKVDGLEKVEKKEEKKVQ